MKESKFKLKDKVYAVVWDKHQSMFDYIGKFTLKKLVVVSIIYEVRYDEKLNKPYTSMSYCLANHNLGPFYKDYDLYKDVPEINISKNKKDLKGWQSMITKSEKLQTKINNSVKERSHLENKIGRLNLIINKY